VPGTRANGWAVLAPLPATAVGIAIAGSYGMPWTTYAPNIGALVLGTLFFFAAQRLSSEKLAAWAPVLAAIGILATLVGPSISGVHRWLSLGPIQLNVSSALAPLILVGPRSLDERARKLAVWAALIAEVVLIVQPDAGQATALSAGVLPLLFDHPSFRVSSRLALALALVLLATLAWLRHDPLPSVECVERILFLAYSKGALWVAAAVLAAATLLVPFLASARGWPSATVRAPICYVVATFVVTFVGNFPVPVFGAGAAPVLGWYALLAVSRLRTPTPASASDPSGTR
jgi:cell division protein FtsW (lipid II flippase)